MSEEHHPKLLAFLAGEFSKKEGRQCVRVDLEYSQPGGYRPERLRTWAREEEPELFDNFVQVEQLTSTIIEIAEGHADSFGMGSHRFLVRTHQHLGGRAMHSFKVVPSFEAGADMALVTTQQSGGGGGGGGEALGVLTQNNTALMRTNQAMFTASFGTLAGLAENLRAENVKLKTENEVMRRELDDARSNKDEREFEIAMKMNKEQRTSKSFDKVLQIGTVIAAKMTGGDKDPGSPTPLSMMLGELGQSLRPEQVSALFNVLDIGQRILFAEIMKMVTPEKPGAVPSNGANSAAHP